MECQAIPQLDVPGTSVLGDGVALGHLRLGLLRAVDGEQGVEHVVAVGDGHLRGGPGRVQHREVGGGDVAQQLVGAGAVLACAMAKRDGRAAAAAPVVRRVRRRMVVMSLTLGWV